MTTYTEENRRELRAMLVANGVKADRAALVIDIACHAADSAMDALEEVVKRSGDVGIAMMAFEIALQLTTSRAQASFERTKAYGEALGLRQYSAALDLPA